MQDFIHQLSTSLKEDKADSNLQHWANYIIDQDIAVLDIAEIIHHKYPVGMRFSWMLGGLCALSPARVFPAIVYFFKQREKIEIKNFNRSLAKMFYLAGIPSEIEGEALDALFHWLQDAHSDVSTKRFALLTLDNCVCKQPDLKNEFLSTIETVLTKQNTSATFEKLARSILLNYKMP
ncbi:MAG: hypothetical protein ACRCYO_14320 [Bacteroidia bacterium]